MARSYWKVYVNLIISPEYTKNIHAEQNLVVTGILGGDVAPQSGENVVRRTALAYDLREILEQRSVKSETNIVPRPGTSHSYEHQ